MPGNLDRFEEDLQALIATGKRLELAIQFECYEEQFRQALAKTLKKKEVDDFVKELPSFNEKYQSWYSEALALLRQVLPDRVADFARHYEKPKGRKDITFENYRIEDYLQGLRVTRGWEKEEVVSPSAAIPQLRQQLAIVEAAQRRFKSSLFDIRHLVHADLLDSELEAAEVLAKHKFTRAAGALAGVVLERHLSQVVQDHAITIAKKNPAIADFNDALKAAGTIDVPQWRFHQHLADIRNLCDHSKKPEPTQEQVTDMIAGVKKVTKTVL